MRYQGRIISLIAVILMALTFAPATAAEKLMLKDAAGGTYATSKVSIDDSATTPTTGVTVWMPSNPLVNDVALIVGGTRTGGFSTGQIILNDEPIPTSGDLSSYRLIDGSNGPFGVTPIAPPINTDALTISDTTSTNNAILVEASTLEVFSVSGDGDVYIGGDFDFDGNSFQVASADVDIGDIGGDTQLYGNPVTINSGNPVDVQGGMDITGTLDVSGAVTMNGNVNAGNSVTGDTLSIVALTTQQGGIQLIPGTWTVTAASSALPSAAANRNYLININNTSGGSVTITANPIIPDGESDRRILKIYNPGANSVVLTTEATDPGSNLILKASTRTLAQYSSIELLWDATASAWVETAFSA